MEDITKPSLVRLARRAGVKSLSDDCFDTIRYLIVEKLTNIIAAALIVNSEHQTKTLMVDDIYDSIGLIGANITQSNEFGTSTSGK